MLTYAEADKHSDVVGEASHPAGQQDHPIDYSVYLASLTPTLQSAPPTSLRKLLQHAQEGYILSDVERSWDPLNQEREDKCRHLEFSSVHLGEYSLFAAGQAWMAILAQLPAAVHQSPDHNLASTHIQEHFHDYYQKIIADAEADLEHLRKLRNCGTRILTLTDAFVGSLQHGDFDEHWPYESYVLAGPIDTYYHPPIHLSP